MAEQHGDSAGDRAAIAEKGRDYWEHGAGAAKIRWGTPQATRRCHDLLMKHAKMTSDQAWGYCAERHKAVTGKWPGQKRSGDMADEQPGTLELDDEWADCSDLPDLSGVTVDMLDAADKEAGGESGGE